MNIIELKYEKRLILEKPELTEKDIQRLNFLNHHIMKNIVNKEELF